MAGLSVAEVLALNPSHKSQMISETGKPAVLLPTDRVEEFSAGCPHCPSNVKRDRQAPA
jgi:hypothetical protein